MKDRYTLDITQHQAKVLNAALALCNQLMAQPPGTPVYPNLGGEGIEHTMVIDELKLLHEEVLRQLQKQDKA